MTERDHRTDKSESRLASRRMILDAALDFQAPALPRTVNMVHALTADRNADARAIARAVLTDFGLTLRFFRIMNSAFFSPYRKDILSIRFMVVLLGLDNTSKVVASVPLLHPEEEVTAARVMGMCLLASEIAGELGAVSSVIETEAAVPCAMFASLGHVVLASVMPAAYERLWNTETFPWSRSSFKRTVGWQPAELGVRVAMAWNLPMLIRECIQPPDDISRLRQEKQALIKTVSSIQKILFCAALMKNSDELQLRLADVVKKVLKISNKRFSAVMKGSIENFQENCPVFDRLLRCQGIIDNLLI